MQRGAVRGVMTLAVTSLLTNQVAKRVWKRPRPTRLLVPLARQTRRRPTSNSLPSGHSASAAAFAVGVGLETPRAGTGPGAACRPGRHVAYRHGRPLSRRRARGLRHRCGRRRARLHGWCRRSCRPGCPPPIRCGWTHRNGPDGAGVVLVVNPASGGGTGARVIDEVREALPQRRDRHSSARATISRRCCARQPSGPRCWPSAAATGRCRVRPGSPIEAGVPLAVFPGGTFNHFAKDIGCDTVAKTVEAIRQRQRRPASTWCASTTASW